MIIVDSPYELGTEFLQNMSVARFMSLFDSNEAVENKNGRIDMNVFISKNSHER